MKAIVSGFTPYVQGLMDTANGKFGNVVSIEKDAKRVHSVLSVNDDDVNPNEVVKYLLNGIEDFKIGQTVRVANENDSLHNEQGIIAGIYFTIDVKSIVNISYSVWLRSGDTLLAQIDERYLQAV